MGGVGTVSFAKEIIVCRPRLKGSRMGSWHIIEQRQRYLVDAIDAMVTPSGAAA